MSKLGWIFCARRWAPGRLARAMSSLFTPPPRRGLWVVRTQLLAGLFVLVTGCGSSSTVNHEAPPQHNAALPGQLGDATLSSAPSPARACEQDNHYPAFKGCPRWRVAMPEACGLGPPPSTMDPCRCMCDLCLIDDDCAARSGGRCIKLPSAMMGGYDESVCVYAGDPCHPDGKCAAGKFCVTYGGAPTCESAPH